MMRQVTALCGREHGAGPGSAGPGWAGRAPWTGERCALLQAPGPSAHRAVLADALAALDGLLVLMQVRDLALKGLQLYVHAQGVVQEAAGAVLGLGAAPVLARARLAVGVERAGLAYGSRRGGRGLSEQQRHSRVA